MRSLYVTRHQRDLHSQRLFRAVGMHMTTGEIGVAQRVRRKSQGRFAGRQLTVSTRLVQEFGLQTKRSVEEFQRVCDVGNVDDGVAEFHFCALWLGEDARSV